MDEVHEAGSRPRPLVIGIGEVLWDVLPEGRRLGGAPANFTYQAHALGAHGTIISAVGEDDDGDEIVRQLSGKGMTTDYITRVPDKPTGTVDAQVDSEGVPEYTIHEEVAWDYLPWRNVLGDLGARADAVCFGTLAQRNVVTAATIRSFLSATRPDCLRLLDLNLRQDYYSVDVVSQSLLIANSLKLSEDELHTVQRLLALSNDEEAAVDELFQRFGLQVVMITRGVDGSTVRTPSARHTHEGFEVEVNDTIGAGDAFAAALAIGLLSGRPLEQINQNANRLAAFICTRPGAMPDLPRDLALQIGIPG